MLYRSLTTTAALALVASSSALAQVDIASALADVRLQFQAQQLIPNPVDNDDIELTSALTLAYESTNLTTGQSYLLPADTSTLASAPSFQLDVSPRFAERYAASNFTAMLVDPGAIGSTLPNNAVTRHYLANNLRLQDGVLSETTGAITSYNAPGPAAGSGPHRYIALVFRQEDDFEAPSSLNSPQPLGQFSLEDYIDDADNLGDIVAMNFFIVENNEQGTATVSTSAVDSTSIAAAASTYASSLSLSTATSAATGSSGGAGSSTASSGPAATSAPASGAAAGVVVGKGAVLAGFVGAVGVALGAFVL